MDVIDSRRLTGPNLLWHRPSAVLDVAVGSDEAPDAAIRLWEAQARRILDAVGWSREELTHRLYSGGFSVALSAPIDALYAATEVNEWAWEAAATILAGEAEPPLEPAAQGLREHIRLESNPALLALAAAAAEHGVACLADDEHVSVGLGKGSRTWPVGEIPAPGAIDWREIHNIPVALVTGTNGKTTTVRLIAAMAEAAGKVAGLTSTDGIRVGEAILADGDFSGPGGARTLLRDPRVEIAVLETARGGMLRRGLALEVADTAVVTNVAEDHLGEWGVQSLEELTHAKFIVERGARRLVLNADDAMIRRRHPWHSARATWFSLEPRSEETLDHLAAGARAVVLEDGQLIFYERDGKGVVAPLTEVPLTLGGAARHNISNALAAVAAAHDLGLDWTAIRRGLLAFTGSAVQNPGRLNLFDVGGVCCLVDFAHNPHGLSALFDTVQALPARRRLVILGQAGDRDDDAIRQLASIAARAELDRIIAKELPYHLRGRKLGEVPRLLAAELRTLGTPAESIDLASSEMAAVEKALLWAQPGDLLLLLVHEERSAVLELIERLRATGWKPGQAFPR